MFQIAIMFKRVLSPLQEFGIAAGGIYLLNRLLSALSPHLRLYLYELMIQPVGAEPLLPARRRASFAIREILPGDPELVRMPVRPEVMAARRAQNATCLGAFNGAGAMIGYLWFCKNVYEEDEVRCTFVLEQPEQSVFDFDFYLFPEYRMGTGFLALWNGAYDVFRQLGIRHTFSRMTRFNTASRRAHRRLGARRVAVVLFAKAWRVELMLATIFPYVHLSGADSKRVRLTLQPDRLSGCPPAAELHRPPNPALDRR
ncbi:MAG: N-acetyltransferase [Casimicrobiaceae bacterium]